MNAIVKHIQDVRSYFAANPDGQVIIKLRAGGQATYNRCQFDNWVWDCLLKKMYREQPNPTGRKYSEEWQQDCKRLARMVNNRIFTRQRDARFDAGIAFRLQHRLHEDYE